MRLFVAADIDAGGIAAIARFQDSLRRIEPSFRWTRSATWHLTLKFIGGVEAHRLAAIRSACGRAAQGCGPLELALAGASAFPSVPSPRVVFVGLEPSPGLAALAGELDRLLAEAGIPAETRPFTPHVTIARAGRDGAVRPSPAFVKALADAAADLQHRFVVGRIVLYESVLGRGGPAYTPLDVMPLSSRQP